MATALVDRETLQRVIDYIKQNESDDFEQCKDEDWTDEQLDQHIYALASQLQDCIDAQ